MPIRVRLTLLMVCGAAILVAASSALLAFSLDGGARATLQQVLSQRSERVVRALQEGHLLNGGSGTSLVVSQIDQSVVQLVNTNAVVEFTTSSAGHFSLLSTSTLRLAARGAVWLQVRRPQWTSPRLILASPAGTTGRVVVVGTSLDQIDDMMRRVVLALLLGGPLVVILTAIGAWVVTGAALAPVERLRAEAAEISAADLGRRLRVPATRDELHALARTLNHLLEELDSALRRQRHFVAAAGHELRTPLARMRTELELALRPARPAAQVRGHLTRTMAGVDRMARVISELLVLARDDEGHLVMRTAALDLGATVASELSAFRDRAQHDRVLLVLNAEPGATARIDELWIRHAVANLLDNALRHTPAGSSVEVLVHQEAAEVLVEVRDQGPGFPEVLVVSPQRRLNGRPTVFNATGGSASGTGLGLWIVGIIMVAHDGRVELHNRPEGGAAVRLYLPRAAEATGGANSPSSRSL